MPGTATRATRAASARQRPASSPPPFGWLVEGDGVRFVAAFAENPIDFIKAGWSRVVLVEMASVGKWRVVRGV